ncbi:MAG: TcmI family type II polyketide cyclase [Acidimicrobiales bacterium]
MNEVDRTLIVAKLVPGSENQIAQIFSESDAGELPRQMDVQERSLYVLRDLYVHIIDFESEAEQRIKSGQDSAGFRDISERLSRHVRPYDPETWRSPADAMARRFYHWKADEVFDA